MSIEFLGYAVEYYKQDPSAKPHLATYPMYRATPDTNKHIGKDVRNYMRSWDGYGLAIIRACWIADDGYYWSYTGSYCWNQNHTRILFRSVEGALIPDTEGFCRNRFFR